ncbi:HNH endonuclease [Sinosporangium album]|uniref:HNH endonuclease n=1 Tax=Sinosporangium album TaxID=504805 RepID=UPI003B82E1A8
MCATSGCARPASPQGATGHCGAHRRRPWADSPRNTARPSDWSTTRLKARLRDGYRCRLCGAADSRIVDHVIPVARGGSWDLTNLRVLCESCHSEKTTKESREGRNRGR